MGVTADQDGNIYVVSFTGHSVFKFNSQGMFVTKWGCRGSEKGNFLNPIGIAADNEGHIYVTEVGNSRVQKFNSNGDFILSWGEEGYEDGNFMVPGGIAVDADGNVYVIDSFPTISEDDPSSMNNDRVQKFSSNGEFITKWGTRGSEDGEFLYPSGIAIDGSGYIYVVDSGNNRVQKFEPDGKFICKWGKKGSGDGEFEFGSDISLTRLSGFKK
ncbi:MAG: hypothetical protein GY795_15265 [Desulfobacterales bacterium]|nr:hypothetical protein [Desulfobacterales bacterium]